MFEIEKQEYTEEEKQYRKPDDGAYVAELADVEDGPTGQYGPSLKFTFKILEEPFENVTVTGLTTAKWRPDNKLDDWLRGLGLQTAEIGAKINPASLKGRQVQIFVEENKKGYATVTKVVPLKKKDTTPAPVVNSASAPKAEAPKAVTPEIQTTAETGDTGGDDDDVPF